jgi:adenylyltransferase/sulfurtransferase
MNPTQALFGRLSVTQLAERLAAGQAPRLIDVREAWEHELASLPGAELMPLSEMQSWWQALDRHEEGFDKLLNLEGGIAAWSREVDPSVPRY